MTFKCGCALEPTTIADRCAFHRPFTCHVLREPGDECPPCFRARLLSVSLSSKAIPTRKGAA